MKVHEKTPARTFDVGSRKDIVIRHVADIALDPDEQITLVTDSGTEFDVVRKAWGYYATPSINKRLRAHGLRGCLVQDREGIVFVLLVEANREKEFSGYMESEYLKVVCWLDGCHAVDQLPKATGAKPTATPETSGKLSDSCPLCGSYHMKLILQYDRPPPGEMRFSSFEARYTRYYERCERCGLFVGRLPFDASRIYSEEYMQTTYESGLKGAYERIMALPASDSDNVGRVRAVCAFMDKRLADRPDDNVPASVLDVGSGLCVFAARMQERGWDCTALDPDIEAVNHARYVVGVKAVQGDFAQANLSDRFDLITFNKVLEHVTRPAAMLQRSKRYLKPDGVVYIELPDGDAALRHGADREEFFVEHIYVFSPASVCMLAQAAGFSILEVQRVHEPSGKFTLRAFMEYQAPTRQTNGAEETHP